MIVWVESTDDMGGGGGGDDGDGGGVACSIVTAGALAAWRPRISSKSNVRLRTRISSARLIFCAARRAAG